ncbi:MAG: transposase, partial [Clostridia bacterium]|nr:transposase [Clostridia bacterium]
PTAWIDHYLSGYRIACKAAERIGGMHILLGMEITFDENANDYLVYGPTEEDLYREPAMYTWGLRRFHDYAAEQGWLVIQAHPFRNHMSVTPPHHIDGIEVCNANPRHDSRNDIATSWANKFQLLKTAGSDYHQLEDLARGGIITDAPITSTAELMEAIRQRAGLYIGNHR